MNKKVFLLFYGGLHFISNIIDANTTIKISTEDAHKIGYKIWHNECAGTIEGLTSWNPGEEFGSFGIGHFIWYPSNKSGAFQETFPNLIRFFKKHHIKIPSWLDKAIAQGCPWNGQDDFKKKFNGPHMKQLRSLLHETINLQIKFIVQRMQHSMPILIKRLPTKKQILISQQFNRLIKTPGGSYALIDYINFKGEGVNPKESYNGMRWGLLQVLEKMHGTSTDHKALQEFAQSAKEVLMQRVKNAPEDRNEQKWIPGWFNRIDTYRAV